MGEALITRRGGIVWEKLTIEKTSSWSTYVNLFEGVWIVPLELYENDEHSDYGMAVFVDGERIYQDYEYYGTVSLTKSGNSYRVTCEDNFSNFGLDTQPYVYKLVT